MSLTVEQCNTLLQIAREAFTSFLETKEIPSLRISDSALLEPKAVFVTVYVNEELRGCMGQLAPERSLISEVQKKVIDAGQNDSRFKPIGKNEVAKLKIKISVLKEMQEISGPEQIEIGKHGVFVKSVGHQGILLPEVAVEHCFTPEKFLEVVCSNKAGVSAQSWRESGMKLFVFETESFGD